MNNKENKGIPYFFPYDYHLTPFQEGIGYDPLVSNIGVMRDAMEKTKQEEEYIY